MESKLMPCICGGEDGWACWKTSDETYYLECESCGYKTKEHKTVADAETEWDKRNGAPMTTSEPTTGEIVRALGNPETLDQESLYYWSKVAADRLEAQEQTIADLTLKLEQAELARDILCGTIKDIEEPKTVGSSTFTIERRGLPQDGEEK